MAAAKALVADDRRAERPEQPDLFGGDQVSVRVSKILQEVELMTDRDQIPIVAYHRGVGIHDMQNGERIEIVKRTIDDVYRAANYLIDWLQSPVT